MLAALAAVVAVLRAPPRLDAEKGALLDEVGVVVPSMHGRRAEDQVEQGGAVDLLHLFAPAAPPWMGNRADLLGETC